MTYDTNELSQYAGQPIELYRFTRGLRIWTYTSADEEIVFNGETYGPVSIRRGDLPQNQEIDNATLDVWLDHSLDVVAEFISGATPTPTFVTLIRRHRTDAVAIEQAVLFKGQVGVIEFTPGESHFSCVPMQKALERGLPRMMYQTQCNNMLYDPVCGVDPALFTFPGVAGAIVGRTLTVAAAASKPDGYYNGGFIRDGESFFFIETHVGTQLQLLAVTSYLHSGDNIFLTAGCDRQQGTCVAKFNNLPNFMGFPYIPEKNPYLGLT